MYGFTMHLSSPKFSVYANKTQDLISTRKFTSTTFIQILALATINFSLAGVRLLIEGGFY